MGKNREVWEEYKGVEKRWDTLLRVKKCGKMWEEWKRVRRCGEECFLLFSHKKHNMLFVGKIWVVWEEVGKV